MDNDLKKSLETRQDSLITLLKEQRDGLDAERQHQIYGAVKEIDYILGMLDVGEEEDEEDEEDEETTDFTSLNDYIEEEGSTMGSDSDVELVKVDEKRRLFKLPFKIKFRRDEP